LGGKREPEVSPKRSVEIKCHWRGLVKGREGGGLEGRIQVSRKKNSHGRRRRKIKYKTKNPAGNSPEGEKEILSKVKQGGRGPPRAHYPTYEGGGWQRITGGTY